MGYSNDRSWSAIFIPEIKWIVGQFLIEEATFVDDALNATDLIILKARDMRIACRMRRREYADRYPYDFTLRSKRDSGSRTELEKIVNGLGDLMFYGFAKDDVQGGIRRWMLIDLAAWRAHLIRNLLLRRKIADQNKSNKDGTGFVAFDIREFRGDPPLIVSASVDVYSGLGGSK